MKLFLVALFLIITFVSQIWGKHYLVKTKDGKTKNGKSKGGKHLYSKCWKSSPDELFTNTCNAKELIYTVFKEDELKAFEKLPKKKKKTILRDIDNIIENIRDEARTGRRNVDLNVDFMKELAKIIGGEDRVRRGLKSMLKMTNNSEDYQMRLSDYLARDE